MAGQVRRQAGGGGARLPRARKPRAKKKGPLDDLKVEVASELGLMEKVRRDGWAELSAAESGRIGGIMTRRLRALGLVPKPARTDLQDDPGTGAGKRRK